MFEHVSAPLSHSSASLVRVRVKVNPQNAKLSLAAINFLDRAGPLSRAGTPYHEFERPSAVSAAQPMGSMSSIPKSLPLPRISARGPSFVQVVVGPDEVIFNAHEKLLTHHSPFFSAALSGNFREAEDKEVTLPFTDPDTFELLVHWLYHTRFPDARDEAELFELWTHDDDKGLTKTNNLINLYVLCDNYDIPALRIPVIDELFNHLKNMRLETVLPNDTMVSYAFENLPDDSPLCCLLVDMHCYYASQCVWNISEQDWPASFLTRVLNRYSKCDDGVRRMDDRLDVSKYHEHGSKEERTACGLKKPFTDWMHGQ